MSPSRSLWPFSQNFILFVTYEAREARMLFHTSLDMLAKDKHSSVLRPFISYEENDVFF